MIEKVRTFGRTKKDRRSPARLTSNISGAFNFESHFEFHHSNDNNYKSIYSYRVAGDDDSEDGGGESSRSGYRGLTFLFGSLLVLFFPILGWFSLKIINKNRKLVVFRYGKLMKITDPGVTFVIPFIDSCQYINTEIKENTISNVSCTTRDQGLVEIDFIIKHRVSNVDYLIKNVINWDCLVLNEARFALLSGVKSFRWSDFDDMRISYDIESHIMQTLGAELIGIEITEVQIKSIKQGKEPEPPMEIFKKINFKALGRQLTTMSPFLMNPLVGGDLANKENENLDESSKERALTAFFEKLEMIKNMAIANNEQLERKPEAVINDMTDASINVILASLIKDYMKKNINMLNLNRIMSEQSLLCLFENTEKVKGLSMKMEDILRSHEIDGDILFSVTKYFKSPCYFHFNHESKMIENGPAEKYKIIVELV